MVGFFPTSPSFTNLNPNFSERVRVSYASQEAALFTRWGYNLLSQVARETLAPHLLQGLEETTQILYAYSHL